MKILLILISLILTGSPVWSAETTPADGSTKQTPPSTLFMTLEEVQKAQALEQAKAAQANSSKRTGLPPAPPPLPEHEAGWPEKLVSGIIKGAAHNESLTNPNHDQHPKPEPVNRNAFSK